jgi:hypothetical protein
MPNRPGRARSSRITGVRSGERVELAVDGRRLHFFDPATETAIGP